MALLLGIDLGTSYFKVGLFDSTGEMKGLGRVPVMKSAPTPGHCELSIDEFWAALRRGLTEALAQARATMKSQVFRTPRRRVRSYCWITTRHP
jgi:xylulokinase